MPHVTMTTTTLPVIVVCSGASLITAMVTFPPTSVGQITSSQHGCSSAATVDSEGHNEEFCWPNQYTAATATSVLDAFSGICKLCHGSSAGESSLSELNLPSIPMSYVGICHGVCFLLSGSDVAAMFTYGCSTIGVCNTATLQSLPLTGIYASW